MNFPNSKKAGFVLMVDTEGEFSRVAFSPRNTLKHKVEMFLSYKLGKDYSINTFKDMVDLLKKYKIPSTFFFVGALFLTKENEYLLDDYLKNKLKTKYLHGKNKLRKVIPQWGEYISTLDKNLFEVSFHNFLHESNFSESDIQLNKSLEFCKKAAAQIGIKSESYAAPWHELEHPENENRIYDILKNNGIKVTRYDGQRTLKSKLNFPDKKYGIFERKGLKCIYGSYGMKTGKNDFAEQRIIENGIRDAIKNNGVYALSTHDTTFLRHGMAHLESILKIVKKYEKDLHFGTLKEMSSLI